MKIMEALLEKLRISLLALLIIAFASCKYEHIPKVKKRDRHFSTFSIPQTIPAKFPGALENYIYYMQNNLKLDTACLYCDITKTFYPKGDVTAPYYPNLKDTTVIDTIGYHIELFVGKNGKVRVLKGSNYCDEKFPESCVKSINDFYNNMPNWDCARMWDNKRKTYKPESQIVILNIRFDILSRQPKVKYTYGVMWDIYKGY